MDGYTFTQASTRIRLLTKIPDIQVEYLHMNPESDNIIEVYIAPIFVYRTDFTSSGSVYMLVESLRPGNIAPFPALIEKYKDEPNLHDHDLFLEKYIASCNVKVALDTFTPVYNEQLPSSEEMATIAVRTIAQRYEQYKEKSARRAKLLNRPVTDPTKLDATFSW